MRTMSAFIITLCGLLSIAASFQAYATDTAPPTIGQQTKGTPAVPESIETPSKSSENSSQASDTEQANTFSSKEYKRENGQVYRLELKHPNAPHQYIDRTGSEGNIESTDNDIEDTPNLPKWKLGSW